MFFGTLPIELKVSLSGMSWGLGMVQTAVPALSSLQRAVFPQVVSCTLSDTLVTSFSDCLNPGPLKPQNQAFAEFQETQ